jgi:hypothetical protein
MVLIGGSPLSIPEVRSALKAFLHSAFKEDRILKQRIILRRPTI